MVIERHYGRPIDMEWAKPASMASYLVPARPATVASQRKPTSLENYVLDVRGEVLAEGAAW